MNSESGFISLPNSCENPTEISQEFLCTHGATCDTFKVFRENKYVFVKRLKEEYADKGLYKEAFIKEFEIGSKIDSIYIPHYIEISQIGNIPSITMEYVDGITLKELVDTKPEYFSKKTNLYKFLNQLLIALKDLHSKQVVHLDLKPENIMLTKVNYDVRIVDLGFCYSADMPFTQGRTSAFAAPEQYTHGSVVDARTDIYAVGKILEYIEEKTLCLDNRCEKIMHRCLKDDKEERYQSISEIIQVLNAPKRITNNILLSVVLLLVMFCIVFYTHLPRKIHHAIYGYDVHDSAYCWNILSDDSLVCEVFGIRSQSKPHFEYSDMTIGATLHYSHKTYKVVQIADSAFAARGQIVRVGIDEGVERIGNSAFIECRNLRVASIPSSVREIGHDAFSWCEKLSSVTLPEGLTAIERAAFHHTALSSIIIPEGVVSIGKDAFAGCENLKNVSLPSSLTNLGRGVFYKCDSLEELIIPKDVRRIGEYILMECPNFKRLYNQALKPQTVFDLFDDPSKVTVFVPSSSVALYKNAPYWKECNIQPME